MDTQNIVENWWREAVCEGMAASAIEAYEIRFGAIPSELRAVIEQTREEATLRAWLKLIITQPAEEVAAALHGSRAS